MMQESEGGGDDCSATTEWLDEHSCPNGHLGGQYGCDFCDHGVVDKSGTHNLNEFLKEQGWDTYDIKKHYKWQSKNVPKPETPHNLVIYFKFCLFGTVWGLTAHATDPRTGIRL